MRRDEDGSRDRELDLNALDASLRQARARMSDDSTMIG